MTTRKFSEFVRLTSVILLLLFFVVGAGFTGFYFSPSPTSQPCERQHVQVVPQSSSHPQGESGTDAQTGNESNGQLVPIDIQRLSPRAGFGLSTPADPVLWARRLGASWYLDWTVKPEQNGQIPEHWQMIRLFPGGCIYPSKDYIRWLAFRYRGQIWIIGNESDVIWQDDLTPEAYAQLYHDLYSLIKKMDPTASIAIAGISQATPLRLAYLDRVLVTYQNLFGEPLPTDWWTVHGFVLQEARGSWGVDIPPGFDLEHGELYTVGDHGRIDLFRQQIISFRRWMAVNGYRDKPLALTEFGILLSDEYGYSPEVIAQYFQDAVSWLDTVVDDQIGYPEDSNRLVQRWAWFSLSDNLFPTSDLANLETDNLTTVGQAYRDYILDINP